MKTLSLVSLGLILLLGLSRSLAADQSARVDEVKNDVHYGSSNNANDIRQASVDTLIQDGEFIGTGKLSLAALTLPSQSVVRIGSYTIFNYTVATNTLDLQKGTVLFCKPKGDGVRTLNIKTAAVMAGIVGTTGFYSVQKDQNTGKTTYSFGLVEGHSTVHADGQNFDIKGGQELQFTPPSHPLFFSFDVPKFVKSSIMFNGFKKDLPNKKYIDEAIARYLDDQSRGFIQPVTSSTSTNYAGISILPTTAFDSAQNAQGDAHGAPPPSNPNR